MTLRNLGWTADQIPQALKERMGDDDPLDLNPRRATRELIAWHLGDPHWFDTFVGFVERFGGTVTFPDGKQ